MGPRPLGLPVRFIYPFGTLSRKLIAGFLSLQLALGGALPAFAQPARAPARPPVDQAVLARGAESSFDGIVPALKDLAKRRYTRDDHEKVVAALDEAAANAKLLRDAAPGLGARYADLARAIDLARLRESALWHSVQDGSVESDAARGLLESLQAVADGFSGLLAALPKPELGSRGSRIGRGSATFERIKREMASIGRALRSSPERATVSVSKAYDGTSGDGPIVMASMVGGASYKVDAPPSAPRTLEVNPVPYTEVDGFGDKPAPHPSPAAVDARKAFFAAASVVGPAAPRAQEGFDAARRDELKRRSTESSDALAAYVAFNREHLAELPDGASFSAKELGLPEDKVPAALVKKSYGGLVGLEYADARGLTHWQSLDGTRSRDALPDGGVVTREKRGDALVVTTKTGSVVFTPLGGGRYSAAAESGGPAAAGRFTEKGFVVEELRVEGARLVPEADGVWAVYGADGTLLGRGLDADARAPLERIARRLLGDERGPALSRALAAALQKPAKVLFLPGGSVVVDQARAGGGVRQLAAVWKDGRLAVFARDAAAPDDPDALRFARLDGAAGSLDAPGLIPAAAALLSALEKKKQAPPTSSSSSTTPADLASSAAYLELAGLAGGTASWTDALLDSARASLGFGVAQAALDLFPGQSRALTPGEQAEYTRLLADVSGSRSADQIRGKLSERYDIKNPRPEDLEELRELHELQQYYDGLLLPGGQAKPGYAESVDAREARLRALRERLEAAAQNRPVRRREGVVAPVDQGTLDKIKALLDEIESLRAEAKGELANRDATKQLLAVQSKLRDDALRQRRDGKNELKVHQNLSRLDTVMRASFALKIILESQRFIQEKLDQKKKEIDAARAAEAQAQKDLAAAQANAAQVAQWKAQAAQTVKDDKSTQATIVDNEKRAAKSVARFRQFQSEVSAHIAVVNARDKGRSADALTEDARRLTFLPTIVQWRTNGNPNDPDAFSLKKFQDLKTTVHQKLSDAQAGLGQLQNPNNAVNFAGVLINVVPGPSGSFTNRADLRNIITARKADYQSQRADYQKSLDSILRMMGQPDSRGNSGGTVVDEFGDAHPESLPKWRDALRAEEAGAQGRVSELLARIDAAAAQINGVAGSNIPMLSGRSLDDLQAALKSYADTLKAVRIPGGDSTAEQHEASLNMILIADLLPRAADDVVTWAKDDGTVKAIGDALDATLPRAKTGIQGVVAMVDVIIADCDKDLGWINNTSGESNQQVFDRKLALVQNTILPALQAADALLDELIAYQRASIAQAQPSAGDLWRLYDAKKSLIQQTLDLYNKTLPWGLASFGGPDGDASGAHASIKSWRDKLSKYMSPDGYDDQDGHHESVPQFQADVAHRKDPAYPGTEVLYGETQPYSLPKKISQYTAERAQRAQQINVNDAQINDIIVQVEQLSKGKYSFGGLRMPVGVTADAAGVARVQAVVDAHVINQLSDALKRIGNDADANSGSLQVGSGTGGSGFPSGTQPPITGTDLQRIALMCVDAGKRLVPTSFNAQNADQGNATYAIARFLFSDSVIAAASDALRDQVPAAEAFLKEAADTLTAAIASTHLDDAYVDSGGTSESPDAIYARQIGLFDSLDRMLKDGAVFFQLKIQWDQAPADPGGSIDKITNYYSSLIDIYNGAITADENVIKADQKIIDALQSTFNDLEKNRVKLAGWLAQLDDPHDSALRRVNESISELQEQTRAVLEQNMKWHDLSDQLARSNEIVKSLLGRIDDRQDELKRILADPRLQDALPPDLVARIDKLRLGRGAWSLAPDAADGSEAIVIRKSQFASFIDTIFGMLAPQGSGRDLGPLKADLLANPQNLSSLLPDAQVIDFGDTADGFYLVYQSKFSVPHGLETGSWVTLGNVAKVWGNNISVTGYQFASPPNEGNAPYGDKGVELQVESLQGRSWVNYLNIDLHRFAFDIPPDMQPRSQVQTSRLMIFDDFAVMVFGDRLYIGAAGFGDIALNNPGDNPSYFGGNLKTSLKLTEVMRLNAEQQVLFAKDPQQFLQTVNVSGYDNYLNGTIYARADDKNYYRTQLGPSFDVGRLISNLEGKPAPADTFTVDLFWSKTGGTDDINQQAMGASILKGFTIRDDSGKPWAVIQNKLTGELGQQYNTLTDRLSVTLPNYGVVITAQGQILGDAKAYYASIAKKLGDNSTLELSYGSPYVGMNDRLSLTMNSSFTLGQLWNAVANGSRDALLGSQALQKFNRDLDDFFRKEADDKRVQELKRVWEQDVARRVLTEDMGVLARKIAELRRAGAILDNTRVRGMVGWVSNPISNDEADRAVGGGFVVGTQTELKLTKTQKAEIDANLAALCVLGLKLQEELIETIEKWQATVVDLAEAEWELKADSYMALNGPTEASRREAAVKGGEAEQRLHQALIAYNILTGRSPTDPVPFDNLTPGDLDGLTNEMRKTIAMPKRLEEILKSLDPSELRRQMGGNPFNLADYLPIVDQLTIGVGVQLQDLMANQIFGVGGSVRIPLFDPSSKARDRAYIIESKAAAEQILQAFAERRLRAQKRQGEARIWKESADAVRPGLPEAARKLGLAIRAYRNGLATASELEAAFAEWHWYITTALNANGRAALEEAWAAVDQGVTKPTSSDRSKVSIDSVEGAIARVYAENHGLAEIALRGQAAAEMTQANDHRIQKAYVDLHVGVGLTASGAGWIPSLGWTGIPVTPVLGFEFKPEELRELEVHRDQSQAEYYRELQAKVKSALAVQFAQNVIDRDLAMRTVALYDNVVIPGLVARGAPPRELDDARLKRDQALLALKQAEATLNFLLGRSADAPLDIKVTPEQALASLRQTLAQQRPVETQRRLLDSRVQVARSVETMIDKDLKVEQLALEPVSLVVRSLSRLISALGGDHIGNPDLVAAARVQTLTEERAREAFDGQVRAAREKARAELAAVQAELARLGDSTAPDAQLARLALSQRAYALQTALLSLEDDGGQAPSSYAAAPGSFAELKDRLEDGERRSTARPPDAPVELLDPGRLTQQASSFLRYYYANQTLGKEPIGRGFAEGWLEVRLKSQDTPPEVLLALAQLRQEKADRLYRAEVSGAEGRADILLADFQADVQLLRWARQAAARPGALKGKDELQLALLRRLNAERDQLVAKLNLPPDTPLDRLAALVPEEAGGAGGDLVALADRFLAQVKSLQIDRVRKTLFDGSLPQAFGGEDNLINQLRADTIAERMSYKGFTPVGAFGVFRGQTNAGVFLEAPDPRAIQAGLEAILTDALRKELVASGKLQELTLKLHSLMSRVEDGCRQIEKRQSLIAASEDEYKALMGRGELAEAERARARVVEAWIGFSDQLSAARADFITLVTELQALGADAGASGLRPFVAAPVDPDLSGLQRDSRCELIAYWADRMRDPAFDLDSVLDSFGRPVPEALRKRLAEDISNYRVAIWNADNIRHKDFTEIEKLTMLSKTDVEGRRLALAADLDELLTGLGPDDSPDKNRLMGFLREDIEKQGEKAGADRASYDKLSGEMRDAYWSEAVDADPAAKAAYDRLEKKAKALAEARRRLLERYLTEVDGDARRFILKDLDLDAYLSAQRDFDDELIAVLKDPATRGNRQLAQTLDALYGIRGSLDRRIAETRSGRGMGALEALIMLEEARLAAARWDGRPPDELDRIARNLQNLKATRSRWKAGSVDLSPVYAVTDVAQDGQRRWSVDGWMTQQEVDAALADGTIVRRDGKLILRTETGDKEVVGGVDAAQDRQDAARRQVDESRNAQALKERLDRYDYALERPARDGSQGYSLEQVFGPGGKHAQGRVFFFEAPQPGDRPGRLHSQLHPLQALALSPDKYVMLVYDGDSPLSRDRFPTLESLQASDDAKDFARLTLSSKGAEALRAQAERKKSAELGRGWVDVKLNSFGFARDKNGAVAEIYSSEDDYKAVLKAFRNAEKDLAQERRDLEKAKAEEARLKAELADKKSDADRATAEYQVVQQRARSRSLEELKRTFPRRRADESEQLYQGRFRVEWDKRVAQDSEFKDAQRRLEPFAKAFNEASERYKQARARLFNAQKAVDEGVILLERAKTWSVYRSDNVQLGLARDGTVVTVQAVPAYGTQIVNDRVGPGETATTLAGPLLAAETDGEGRVKAVFQNQDALEKAAKSWQVKTVTMTGERDEVSPDGRTMKPTYRLSHYEDPATQLPIALSRRFMAERAEDAQSKAGRAKNWGLMPWNWGNLVLELPRGIVDAPIELITGRDPNQQHYLGRVYMYKTEGGETEHRGFFRKVLGVIDVLDILPDPVSRFYDPSQFPSTVRVDSPVLPGQSILDKDVRDKDKDVHFGVGSASRVARQSLEDLSTARARTLAHFHGGVETTLVEQVRGRGGVYQDSRRSGQSGDDALRRAITDPSIGSDPRSDGSGTTTSSATPGNLAVDRVERRVFVRPGADQYQREIDALKGYRPSVPAADPKVVDAERERADAELARALQEREAAQKKRLITDQRISWWQDYLRRSAAAFAALAGSRP